jgi:O-antigen/teichoic acid export membrane protein
LTITKLFATYFGANGLTLLAHFQNLLSIVTTLAGEGLNKGIIKFLSNPYLNPEDKQQFFVLGILLQLGIFVSACLVGFLYGDSFATQFADNFSSLTWSLLVAIPLLANLFNLFLIAVIQSQQRFKLFSFLNSLNIILSAVCIYLSISYNSLPIALLAYGIGQGLALCITLPVSWRYLPLSLLAFSPDGWRKLQTKKLLQLLDFMLIGLSIVLFSRLGTYILREYNIGMLGMTATGLWEAVMRLSDGHTFVFNATFIAIFYPKVAGLAQEPAKLRSYLWQTFRFILPLIAVGLFLIFVFKSQIITLLFDASFLNASFLVSWVLLGDFFKLISYLLSNLLIAQGRSRLFVLLQGVFMAQYFLLMYLLIPHFGLLALGITWVTSYLISVIVLTLILRKTIWHL